MTIGTEVWDVDRESAERRAKDELKERMWREIWKDCVELQGVRVQVGLLEGIYVAKAVIDIDMTLNEFQKGALETAVYPEQYRVIYPALGLAGEAGETADKVKKVLRGDDAWTEERKRAVALEIGDVLWYCAALAWDLGYSLEEIGRMNHEKLASRKARGKLGGDGDER